MCNRYTLSFNSRGVHTGAISHRRLLATYIFGSVTEFFLIKIITAIIKVDVEKKKLSKYVAIFFLLVQMKNFNEDSKGGELYFRAMEAIFSMFWKKLNFWRILK